MRKPQLKAENRPGATLIVVAVALVAIMGFGALALDVGMLGTAKAQARRAAEAGALAGALSFQGVRDSATAVAAADSAAWLNSVLNQLVGSTEVSSVVIRDSFRVRTTVTRSNVTLGLARFLGFQTKTISELAAADVRSSNAAGCLKPFAIPDQPPFNPPDSGAAIHRIWQWQDSTLTIIGFYGAPPGVGEIQSKIENTCASNEYVLYMDSTTSAKPGNTVTGPARKGMQDVICSEVSLGADALRYTPGIGFNRNGVVEPNWRSSPRVGTVALYTPQPIVNGTNTITISGFINVFFEYMTVQQGMRTDTIDGYSLPPCNNSGGSGMIVYGRVFAARGVATTGYSSSICDPTKAIPCVLRLVQ